MNRVPVADPCMNAQSTVRFDHVDVDDMTIGKDGEIDRLVERQHEVNHFGLGETTQALEVLVRLCEGAEARSDPVSVALPVMVEERCCRKRLKIPKDGRLRKFQLRDNLRQCDLVTLSSDMFEDVQ